MSTVQIPVDIAVHEFRKIGTMTLVNTPCRSFPIDMQSMRPDDPHSATVNVFEGTACDVVTDGFTTLILYRGTLNVGRSFRIGDGIFTMTQADAASDIEIVVPSKSYGPDEWEEYLNDTICRPGTPDQRWVISAEVSA